MRVSPNQLTQHLDKDMPSLYILYGSEDFLVDESLKQIREKYTTSKADRMVFQCDGANTHWETLSHHFKSPDLFSPIHYLEVHLNKLLPADPPKLLACLAERLPEQICVIRCSAQLKAVHRAKWLQSLEATAVIIGHFTHSPQQYQQWIAARAKKANVTLSADHIAQMAYRTQGNYLAAANEIDILALCDTASKTSTVGDPASTQNQFDPNTLIEAILMQQPKEVCRILSSLKVTQGVALSLVLWLLAQYCRVFIQSHTLSTTEQKTRLLYQMGVRKSQHALLLPRLQRSNILAYKRAICRLSEIDYQLKSGELSRAWEQTLTVCIDMSGASFD